MAIPSLATRSSTPRFTPFHRASGNHRPHGDQPRGHHAAVPGALFLNICLPDLKSSQTEAIELRVGVAWGRTGGHNEGILTQLPKLGKVSSMWIIFLRLLSLASAFATPNAPLPALPSFLFLIDCRDESNIVGKYTASLALLNSSRIEGFRIFQSCENN